MQNIIKAVKYKMSFGCQACVSCENCEGCRSACDTCQSFCETGYQAVGGFSFNECVAAGQVILHKTNWNRLISYIREAYTEGALCNAVGQYNLRTVYNALPVSDPNIMLTAEVFNAVSNALTKLTDSYSSLSVRVGDIVYGSYFTTLQNYANTLKYKWGQCNLCNASCDALCNGSCNSCNAGSQSVHCCSSSCEHSCQDTPTE